MGGNAQDWFDSEYDTFSNSLRTAIEVSISIRSRFVPQRDGWASWLYGRVCANGSSIRALASEQFDVETGEKILDHFSIGSIARTMIEASIVMMYISDQSITQNEWELRKSVIDLNDFTHRTRLFKPFGAEAANYAQGSDDDPNEIGRILKAKIKENAIFKGFHADKRKILLSGKALFVNGLREAAADAGWDRKGFDFFTTYMSAYIHSLPVSFYRTNEHKIDFLAISEFQFKFCALVLEHLTWTLDRSRGRIEELFSVDE